MTLFWLQLRGELTKLFARKRTYLGFGAFLGIEALVLFMLQLPKPKAHFRRVIEDSGYIFEQYFSGLTMGLLILMWTTFLLGALYLALVAGDVISKEVEDGTMRMTLCRPISRLRIVVIKYAACVIYTFALVAFIAITALLAGMAYRGTGGLLAYAPQDQLFELYEAGPGLLRYLCAIPALGLGLLSITSLGFMFSCFNMKPAAATIATLSLMFLDSIFRNIPYFESLRPYFITARIATWLNVFHLHIPWEKMTEDYAYLIALDLTFLLIGLASFHQRDFKS
ncbi:MAG: type transport system permease protein [Chthoniobacter sp.]|jgi:ABC-2 type transport system permease protein|nr:type transport system permease protein [Chthoniobacter sp.]